MSTTQIEEVIPVQGASVGLPGDSITRTVTVSADLTNEYTTATGGGLGIIDSVAGLLTKLPPYIDDVTANFDPQHYVKMLHDPNARSSIMTLLMGGQVGGVHLVPAKRPDDPRRKQAEQIADFCNANLSSMERPFPQTLFDLSMAVAYGYRIGEKIYVNESRGIWGRKTWLKAIRVKPNDQVAFVVDQYRRLIGLVPRNATGQFPTVSMLRSAATRPDGSLDQQRMSEMLLPPEKFAIATWMMTEEDPRGQSQLRAAYHAHWHKVQIYLAYLAFLARFAEPTIWGTTPQGANAVEDTDRNGQPIAGTRRTAQVALKQALEQMQSGAAGAFPYGTMINALLAGGEGAAFLNAIALDNEEMTKAILYQTLATTEGKFQARAAAQTHQDVLGMLVRFFKQWLAEFICNDILHPLIRYNFGPEAVDLCPSVTLGEVEHQDFNNNANAISALWQSGYLHWTQQAQLDSAMGLPERDMRIQRAEEEQAQQMQQQQAEATLQSRINKTFDANNRGRSGASSGTMGGGAPGGRSSNGPR